MHFVCNACLLIQAETVTIFYNNNERSVVVYFEGFPNLCRNRKIRTEYFQNTMNYAALSGETDFFVEKEMKFVE